MPVLLGLPWLAGILITALGGVVGFFLKYFTHRLAVTLAVIAAITALTVTFVAVMAALQAGLGSLSEYSGTYYHLLLPDDFGAIVGVYLSARLAKWVYGWNVKVVQLRLF